MATKQKVLLIGANGIVGTALCEKLFTPKIELTVISRKKPCKKINFIKHSANLPINKLKIKLTEKFDTVIINSGYIKNTNDFEGQSNNFEINIKYIVEILNLLKDKKPNKIIYTSTFAFLQKPFLKTITETHPIAASSQYSAAKFLAESAVISFCDKNKVNYYCFRIPSPVNVDHISLHKNVLSLWIKNAQNNIDITIHGQGKRCQNFISTNDISEIYFQAIIEDKTKGVYNLASISSLSMQELAGLISKQYGSKIVYDITKQEDVSYNNISINKLNSEFNTDSFLSSKKVISELLKRL